MCCTMFGFMHFADTLIVRVTYRGIHFVSPWIYWELNVVQMNQRDFIQVLFLIICLLLFQNNIEPCPECGNMKLKHVLCGFCYEKVRMETVKIRKQISIMEGGPLNTPAVESVVLYENETPSEADKNKRIIERSRKRPYWFHM